MSQMDRISQLPDALLLRIQTLLPTAKDVVATMVLSKRWQPLWKLVPRLVYDDSYQNNEYGKFSRFVDRSLILHEAPVETLHFKLINKSGVADVGVWTAIAIKRCVRGLIIELDCRSSTTPVTIPRSLYTGCRMLVSLKLKSVILVDVSSLPSFPTLKTLSLLSVKYPGDEFVKNFFSNCHALQDLVVDRCLHDNVTIFTIIVPSLKSVSLYKGKGGEQYGFVIDAPLLEIMDILDYVSDFCVIENAMLKIVKASVDVSYSHPGKILGYITSVKRLFLCLFSTSKEVYPVGTDFHCLVHLTLCTCETEWLNLLMYMLRNSPTLQALNLKRHHTLRATKPQQRPCWDEPSSVPECLLWSLETLKWVDYEGTTEEKEVAAFILRNGSCLKKATISSKATDPNMKLEMIKELSSSPRRSPTCQLIFD